MKLRNVQGGFSAVRARRARGFSLIELMIVIVIVGVLSAIAWPSYQNYVRRGHRSAAQTFMMTIAQRQEQYLLTNRSYTATISDLGGLTQPSETVDRYTFAVATTVSPPTYTITATAVGNQVVPNKFGDLTLGSDGTKTSPAVPPAEEWKR